MNRCAYCGDALFGTSGVCSFHTLLHEDDWARANRIMCDFIHRGIVVAVRGEDVGLKAA